MATPVILSFFLLLFPFHSGPEKPTGYVNHKKWLIDDIYNMNPLKAKPREVSQNYYEELNDTSFSSINTLTQYHSWKFDRRGNMVFTKRWPGKDYITEVTFSYDANGVQTHVKIYDTLHKKTSSESKEISVRSGKNNFRATYYYNGKYNHHRIETFSEDGQTVKTEEWIGNRMQEIRTDSYKGDRQMKTKVIEGNKTDRREMNYYYSEWGFMDSIVESVNGKRSGVTVYINNEHGDPISYTRITRNELEEKSRMEYQYDQKGNWEKLLIKIEYAKTGLRAATPRLKFPAYGIFTRKIEY